jgi:hypothetical protein
MRLARSSRYEERSVITDRGHGRLLHGVPFTVRDLIDTADVAQRGLLIFKGRVPTQMRPALHG